VNRADGQSKQRFGITPHAGGVLSAGAALAPQRTAMSAIFPEAAKPHLASSYLVMIKEYERLLKTLDWPVVCTGLSPMRMRLFAATIHCEGGEGIPYRFTGRG
jgi:hypothetical protein